MNENHAYTYPSAVRIDLKFHFVSDAGKKAAVGQKNVQDPPTRQELGELARSMQGQLQHKFGGKWRVMSVDEVDDWIADKKEESARVIWLDA